MKNIFKAIAMFMVSYTTITAADTLVIGCRPWDENIQTVNGLSQAHFVDFRADGAPVEAPNFHHLDLNDAETFSAGKFSEFAAQATEQYKTIIIDWITYQHISRDKTWRDFFNLLGEGGKLIVPITLFYCGKPASEEGARTVVSHKLEEIGFKSIEIFSHDAIIDDKDFALLTQDRGGGMLGAMLSFKPAIIIASK